MQIIGDNTTNSPPERSIAIVDYVMHFLFESQIGMRRCAAVWPHIFGTWMIFLPPKIWPCLPFYSDLVGSYFELRSAHPYWFLSRVPPNVPSIVAIDFSISEAN